MKVNFLIIVLLEAIMCFILGVSGCGNDGPSYGNGSFHIEEFGKSVAVDRNGNVYLIGLFTGTVDFNPGLGVDEHRSTDLSDIFISAFDSSGTFLWARTWDDGYTGYHGFYSDIAVDDNGIVNIAGSFWGTVDLYPGPGVDEHSGNGVYLSRFDSDGGFNWARSWTAQNANSIAIDMNGNLYITGGFGKSGSTYFDPGFPEVETLGSGVYLSKFDSDGNFSGAITWDGYYTNQISVDNVSRNGHYTNQMAVDNDGDVYLSGTINGTVDFDPGPSEENHTGSGAPFLCKVDAEGNFVWVRTLTGPFKCLNTYIAIDTHSNLLVAGTFTNYIDLDPDSTSDIPVSNGKADIFLYNFNTNGDLLWKRTWGGSESDFCQDIAVDNNGKIYATGYFTDTVDFDPGPFTDEHRSSGGLDVYISKFDASGNFEWARTWGGSGWDKGNGIAVATNGNIYITGEFCGRVDFDPGSGRDWYVSIGYNDIFLSKFDLNGNFIWTHTWGGENPFIETEYD